MNRLDEDVEHRHLGRVGASGAHEGTDERVVRGDRLAGRNADEVHGVRRGGLLVAVRVVILTDDGHLGPDGGDERHGRTRRTGTSASEADDVEPLAGEVVASLVVGRGVDTFEATLAGASIEDLSLPRDVDRRQVVRRRPADGDDRGSDGEVEEEAADLGEYVLEDSGVGHMASHVVRLYNTTSHLRQSTTA